jgi:hypothetical protein
MCIYEQIHQLGLDTSQCNLSTWFGTPANNAANSVFQLGLGHQLIQSFNSVWDTSWFSLSTWFGYQPIQSFNLVWDTSRFSLSTWFWTPADSIFPPVMHPVSASTLLQCIVHVKRFFNHHIREVMLEELLVLCSQFINVFDSILILEMQFHWN